MIGERLAEYRKKRTPGRTPEPRGEVDSGSRAPAAMGRLYVMHKHAARNEHFDLRLEQHGVLRSWALPKGPSLEPGEKRLAVQVEDHPLEYARFEGVIPRGAYGGGTVMIWDLGRWRAKGKASEDRLDFVLEGEKLAGAWTLTRMRARGARSRAGKDWLMIKRSDRPRRKLEPGDASVASGRTMDEIARDHGAGGLPPPSARDIAGAREATPPSRLEPQLATPADEAPEGDDWLHEIKLDGYRLIAHVDGDEARLWTRRGEDWTHRFPRLAERLPGLGARLVVDGEVVAMAADGSTSFRALQEALASERTEDLVYTLFDLLYLDGFDLRDASLVDRKRALSRLLRAGGFTAASPLRYSDHVRGRGRELYDHACQLGLEGIVSKRAAARYRGGRSRQWLKIKCTRDRELVVGGYASGKRALASLLLGAYDGRRFVYAGRVGTGFGARQRQDLLDRLGPLETGASPFQGEVPDTRNVRWVEPRMVVEVEFTERTRDGRHRHPVFRGLREDRNPEEITVDPELATKTVAAAAPARKSRRDGATRVAGVRLTHPDKVMYPEQGITKIDLARYYEGIESWVLPHLASRPLSLVRCPDGRDEECFYQKHPGRAIARGVPRVDIEERDGTREYVYVESIADVVALVQAGVLEIHPWGCRIEDIEHPDTLVLDLDPAPAVAWSEVVGTARELRDRLGELGLSGFLRTTGGKGLHVVVPLKPRASWSDAKVFAKALAAERVEAAPDRRTVNMAKARRRGKIFLDYLRNGRGATAIASYSVRARPDAPVAVPLRWDEINSSLRSDRYRLDNIRRRLAALPADPWEGFAAARRPLTGEMLRAVVVKT